MKETVGERANPRTRPRKMMTKGNVALMFDEDD